jgi:hypothetical protein
MNKTTTRIAAAAAIERAMSSLFMQHVFHAQFLCAF